MKPKSHHFFHPFKVISILAIFIFFVLFLLCYTIYCGYFIVNDFSARSYPIRGVDVSHYQGSIDWAAIAEQDIDFAYIKATEGSSHTDENFEENWSNAQETKLKIGAYHFFSFDSSGKTQLEHFTKTLPETAQMLPPVVDVEYYGNKKAHPPKKEDVVRELQLLLSGLEKRYRKTPILYSTEEVWDAYLKEDFTKYPLWIRNIWSKPKLGGRKWLFWQYTNRGRLEGYDGKENFIDLNVYEGTKADWEQWVQP